MNELIPNRILPVAIMAHNEARVIEKSIKSCFDQVCPIGYTIILIVVANGCTDNTEYIVNSLVEKYDNKIKLISMKDKGKTKALNRAIAYFIEEVEDITSIPYVIFMDADCEFVSNDAFIKFVAVFREIPLLCAVGATNVPNIIRYPKSNLVSSIYIATNELNNLLPENGITGGAYCIKHEIMREIKFPEIQMADDMFVSLKLDGWMLRDKDIKVSYTIPSNLSAELNKRIRHEIAIKLFFEYNQHLITTGHKTALFNTPLASKYRWTGFSTSDVLRKLIQLKGIKYKSLICLSIIIRLLAKIIAFWKFKHINKSSNIDYWQVER